VTGEHFHPLTGMKGNWKGRAKQTANSFGRFLEKARKDHLRRHHKGSMK